MPDAYDARPGTPREPAAVPIAPALRALPLEGPRQDQWPRLADSLAARPRGVQRHRRIAAIAALAAALLVALALPRLLDRPQLAGGEPPQALVMAAPSQDTRIDALIDESVRLEAVLAAAGEHDVANGTTLLLRAHMIGRIQYLDALLADPATDPSARVPLWQERVVVLRRLAGIEGGEQLLAAQGDAADSSLVLTF